MPKLQRCPNTLTYSVALLLLPTVLGSGCTSDDPDSGPQGESFADGGSASPGEAFRLGYAQA